MKVRSGAVAGNGQTIENELDMNDMRDVPGFESMTPYEQWRAMTDRADMWIIEYKVRRGEVTAEWGAARIKEIKGIKDE
jgi:hypothetical protein